MLVNKFNLSISEFCTPLPVKGNASDVLHVTENSTLVSNGEFAIEVSAIRNEPGDITGTITKEWASRLSNVIKPTDVRPMRGKFPIKPEYREDKPAVFELCLDAPSLLTLAQQLAAFGGKAVRIRFTGESDPVQLETRSPSGQKMQCLLAPRIKGVDKERFADPEPELSAFEKAMQMAAALGGGQ